MAEFDRPMHDREIEKATARLPNIDIEITHHRAARGDAEQFFINIQAVPSFEAFGRFLEATNPFAFWAQASRLAWLSWVDAARFATFTLPLSLGAGLPKNQAKDRPRSE